MMRRCWIGALAMGLIPLAAGAEKPGNGLVIILLGPPGAGKTTQSEFLKKHYKIPFFSAAEIVRKSQGKKSGAQRGLAPGAASGELLADDALNQLMLQTIQKSDFTRGFILDGYPANRAQAEFFNKTAGDLRLPVPAIVVLDVPDNVARDRMTARRRADDAPANIERRLADYHREFEAVRQSYPAGRILRVDGTKPEKEISGQIAKLLEALN